MAEEWCFVSHGKGSKHRRRRDKNGSIGPSDQHQSAGGSGLYRALVDGGTSKRQDDEKNSEYAGINQTQTVEDDEQRRREIERIKRDILECLHALEDQLHSGGGFAFRLITSLVEAASAGGDRETDTATKEEFVAQMLGMHLRLCNIVAYGIGNFAIERFQAPMLQLACLLLIRRCAAASTNPVSTDATRRSDHKISEFEYDQRRVPIFYYEPCILPIEMEVLASFHIHVLESNDMGKRSVGSMRQQCQEISTTAMPRDAHTLYYMPHCPMRLYSNILWANWDHMFPKKSSVKKQTIEHMTEDHTYTSNKNPVLIFGNSFCAYDERTISSKERSDPTNGVLRIAPFAKEMPTCDGTSSKSRRGGDEITADALRHLEIAFNDCNVISFPIMQSYNNNGGGGQTDLEKETVKRWPDRPKEWFASQDHEENGELR